MSAPPGWHPQPDGRERYWDGTRWTDEFRAPAPTDAAAPPPPPSWASPEPTQAIDIDRTQVIPAPDPAAAAPSSGPVSGGGSPGAPPPWQPAGYGPAGGQSAGYDATAGTVPGAPPPGPVPPGTGYGSPGTPWQPPPQQGRSRGCLVAAIVTAVVLLVVVGLVVWGVFAVGSRVVDTVESAVPTRLPTELPSNLPTELPSDLPTNLPTAAPFDIEVGQGFDLPRAEVAGGWTLSETSNLGARVQGMRATFREPTQVPAIFSLSFTTAGGDTLETACTSQVGGQEVTEAEISCIPIFGDVSGVESV
ncbi:MAG: DUF2510 domain-containing protein, partial [Phycicoccus sp.]